MRLAADNRAQLMDEGRCLSVLLSAIFDEEFYEESRNGFVFFLVRCILHPAIARQPEFNYQPEIVFLCLVIF